MLSRDDKFYVKAALGWILVCTIFRLAYSGAFPLIPDETNYWQWSRHLAWGYHDQAPMIAWAIKLATSILGHTEIGVRLPSVVSLAVASIYLVGFALRWISPLVAFQTALLTQSVLAFNVGGILSTPDGLQAAAWAGASYHVACAYENHRWREWLVSGLWFGFGMLSKYTMVIFLPGAFLYGLFSPIHRKRLASLKPYIGVLLGFMMFFPVIVWNAKNGWSSVRHVAFIGGANEKFGIHFKYFGEYLGGQAGMVSPLIFILICLAWTLALRKKFWLEGWIYPYLFFTSFPIFAGFGLLSLHSRVEGNWPGAGYFTASVLVAAFFSGKFKPVTTGKIINLGRKIWPWAVGGSYLLTALLLLYVVWPFLPIPAKQDRILRETSGWRELGIKANAIIQKMPHPKKTFLFGLQYQEASELAFYTPGNPRTVSINKWSRPNVYDYWWKDEDLIGWDAVGVTYGAEIHKNRLLQVFDHVEPPIEIKIFRHRGVRSEFSSKAPLKVFYLYRAYGFKGGLRWVPTDMSDIRTN